MPDKITRRLSQRDLDEQGLLEGLNREVLPTLRQMHDVVSNAFGKIIEVAADTTVTLEHQYYFVDASAGPVTITLPAALAWKMPIYVKKTDSSGNAVTVTVDGVELIDGATTDTLSTQYESYQYVSNGNDTWWVL